MRSTIWAPRIASRGPGSPFGFRSAAKLVTIASRRDELPAQAATHLRHILLMLQDRAERGVHNILLEVGLFQRDQRRRPVERLGDAGHLVEIHLAEVVHEAADLAG